MACVIQWLNEEVILRLHLGQMTDVGLQPVRALLAVMAFAVGGCATIEEGTAQSVAIDTQPAGATCQIVQYGGVVGSIVSTPGSTRVQKSQTDIGIVCAKPGFQTARLFQTPTFKNTTLISNWGFIGLTVDASTGANYAYPDIVHLTLAPAASGAVAYRYPGVPPSPERPWKMAPEMDRR